MRGVDGVVVWVVWMRWWSGCRKDHLLRGIRKANCVHGSIYNISPIAFVLPSEYTKFCDEYANQPENTKATWICKPHSGRCQADCLTD